MIKVFVSSTFKDLVEHRSAVLNVLHRMHTQVDAMEYFGARPDTAERVCAADIRDCDILIGVYAWRYGWQPQSDGPSITEQEFDAAVLAGIPCLCYVVDDNTPWLPAFVDRGDAGERLARFKDKVGQFVTARFTTPDDLAKRVATDLGNLIRAKAAAPAISPTALDWSAVPATVRHEVMAILRALPDDACAAVRDADSARFVLRSEWFGSLVYDRQHDDYIAFDQEASDIFRLLSRKSLDQVFEQLGNHTRREAYQTFVRLCQSIGLLDTGGRFTAAIIEAMTPPVGRLSAPLRVHISCTSACNFSCRHCWSSSGRPGMAELTTQEVRALIDQLADMACLQMTLGGGEPLVRADLREIVRHANRRGVALRLSTHAAAASVPVVDSLRDLRIEAFKVSVEGSSDAVYDAVRGEAGAFRRAMQGLEQLKTLGVPIEFHRVLMRPNVGDLDELARLAQRHGASKLVLEPLLPVGRAAGQPELLLGEAELEAVWSSLDALAQLAQCPVVAPHRAPFSTRHLFTTRGCECGNIVCHVDAQGNVSATGMARNLAAAGNLREQSLRAIWSNAAAFAPFRAECATSRCLVRGTSAPVPPPHR